MKTLYIPEIGTELTLADDWTFTLHAEDRNETLAAAFGYALNGYNNFSDYEKLAEIQAKIDDAESRIVWPDEDNLPRKLVESYNSRKQREQDFLENQEAYIEYNALRDQKLMLPKIDCAEVTIPAGFVLKVDRIYIRKGISYYSSLTFFVKDFKEIKTIRQKSWCRSRKVKSLRFWAKLEDCNKIKFV